MKKNKLKAKLLNDEIVIGPFLKIIDPALVEISAYAGFDFVIIDSEHGPINMESAQNLIRAAEAADITPIIRVLRNEEETLLKALDIGPHGIEVPQINNLHQVQRLKKSVKYNPEGQRGVCCYVRAADYSKINRSNEAKQEYFKRANEELLVIAHIEGLEGVENIDKILKEEVIDVVFIGPYDLSQSLGKPGQVDNPAVKKEMEYIIKKAKQQGKIVGTFVDNVDNAREWIDIGVRFIAYSVDVGIFYEKCAEIVSDLK